MDIPDIFILILPFLLLVTGEAINPKAASIGFCLLAAIAAWLGVAYPELSTVAARTETGYWLGYVYLGVGFVALGVLIVKVLGLELGPDEGRGKRCLWIRGG